MPAQLLLLASLLTLPSCQAFTWYHPGPSATALPYPYPRWVPTPQAQTGPQAQTRTLDLVASLFHKLGIVYVPPPTMAPTGPSSTPTTSTPGKPGPQAVLLTGGSNGDSLSSVELYGSTACSVAALPEPRSQHVTFTVGSGDPCGGGLTCGEGLTCLTYPYSGGDSVDMRCARRKKTVGESCGGYTSWEDQAVCAEGLICHSNPSCPDCSGKCFKRKQNVGESCGGYTSWEDQKICAEGLICHSSHNCPDCSGNCVKKKRTVGESCGGLTPYEFREVCAEGLICRYRSRPPVLVRMCVKRRSSGSRH